MSDIEWTDKTWNPIIGCTRVSAGCEHCYAETVAHRGMSEHHRGLTLLGPKGVRWNGTVRFVLEALARPLSWKKPRKIFVNSMSDLFHEALTNEQIAAVFGVMASCPQHTFQVLTKRPKRMREWFDWMTEQVGGARTHALYCALQTLEPEMEGPFHAKHCGDPNGPWPLPNVWLGVSVEDQEAADTRLPWLIDEDLPAAVRFVSYEPALGPVDFTSLDICRQGPPESLHPYDPVIRMNALTGHVRGPDEMIGVHLDWVIVGGESGPRARPFDLAWARSVIEQCARAGVAVFCKQLGAKPIATAAPLAAPQSAESIMRHGEYDPEPWEYAFVDRKGGDMAEWPAELRVRQFPEVARG